MARSRAAPARSASSAAARPRPAPSPAPAAAPSHSSSGYASSAPRAPPPPAPAPAPVSMAPPPAVAQQSSGGGMMSGLMGAVVQGAAMGTGSAIAHRAIGSLFGGGREEAPAPAAAPAPASYQATSMNGPCEAHVKAFADCMSRSNGDISACSSYFDIMQQCKMSA